MGKTKKKNQRSTAAEQGNLPHRQNVEPCEPHGAPEELIASLGAPKSLLALGSIQDTKDVWGDARVVLPAETIYSAHLYTSQHVLVGIALPSNAEGESTARISNGDVQQDEQVPVLQSIWGAMPEAMGIEPHFQPPLGQPGGYLVPATVYPGPKLPRQTAAVTQSLHNSLGRPCIGACILIFTWPSSAAADISSVSCPQKEPASSESPADRVPQRSVKNPRLYLRLSSKVTERKSVVHEAERLAKDRLAGRRLLPGNPVLLTVLGQPLLFAVEDSTGGALGSDWSGYSVGKSTDLKVLVGDEIVPQPKALAIAAPISQVSVEAAAATAAHSALGGGPEGVAAVAAARAASLGARAASDGYSRLGGVSEHIKALREHVALPLKAPKLFERLGLKPPRGVLLYGPPGTGKTALACAAAADAGAALFVLNGPDIISEYVGESELGLQGIFAAARAATPAVIFIDELDALAPARAQTGHSSAADEMTGRVVSTLLAAMDMGSGVDGVIVIGATNRVNTVDAALRRPGRFDRELEVSVPSPAGRLEILRVKLDSISHDLHEEDMRALAASCHGFVGADLAALCQEAAMCALRRVVQHRQQAGSEHAIPSQRPADLDGPAPDKLEVTLVDFRAAQTRVRPSGMREVALELPKVTWADVGGHSSIKQRLKEAVEWPQKHPETLARMGAKAPRGVLLYGPPGCSKTLLARAVASESGLNFLAVKGSELFSMYVGESEKAVVALFSRARAAAPSVIFLDEIDGLAAARTDTRSNTGSPSVGDRVLSQLLVEMDGIQARGDVTVVAATNRPDLVDAALLRPGRFDSRLYVPPPQGAADRSSILGVLTRTTPLAQDVNLDAIADLTPGFTGADLNALLWEASMIALTEDIEIKHVAMSHFLSALSCVTPSPGPSMAQLEMYAAFQQGIQA